MDKLIMLLATGFGLGRLPKAPGTWGTLLAFPIQGLFLLAALPPLSYALWLGGLFLLGVWAAGSAEKILDRADPGQVVIDEMVGMLIALIAVPPTLLNWLAAFFIFRFFDIVKPFPIGFVDRNCHGGLGIMLDDVLAGLYALAVIHLLLRFLPL